MCQKSYSEDDKTRFAGVQVIMFIIAKVPGGPKLSSSSLTDDSPVHAQAAVDNLIV